MRDTTPVRRHKNRALGFIPNQNGQDNPNNGQNAAGPGSSSAAASSPAVKTTTTTAASVSRAAAGTTTTTTTPAAVQTTTTTTTTPSATSSSAPTTSDVITATSTPTTVAVVQPTTQINVIPTTATLGLSRSLVNPITQTISISASAASASSTADSSSGTQIGPLVGAIGGGLVGVIALAAIAGYFFRRAFRKKDDFDRSEFVRNSVAINDGWNEKPAMGTQNALALARANNDFDGPSATPRPPSMIERRGQPSYGVGEVMDNNGYYGHQDQYYNYGNNNGYYGHDQYAAGYDHQQYPAQDQGYAAAGGYGYTPPNEYQQSQLTRKPSAPMGTARVPGSEYQEQEQQQQHDQTASPATAPQYDSRHQSVTPFQQQQYNDINKALNGGVTPTAETSGRELPTAYSTLNQPQQPAQAHTATPNPHATANRRSVYEDEDAYGGI